MRRRFIPVTYQNSEIWAGRRMYLLPNTPSEVDNPLNTLLYIACFLKKKKKENKMQDSITTGTFLKWQFLKRFLFLASYSQNMLLLTQKCSLEETEMIHLSNCICIKVCI